MRLTVLGSGAACAGMGGNSSGYLVEDAETRILLDCGHGVASTLVARLSPETIDHIFISHMHADHFVDLLPLRFAISKDMAGLTERRGHLHLPPAGKQSLQRLLEAVSFPRHFFDSVWHVREYQPGETIQLAEGICARFAGGIHYIPGWGVRIDGASSLTYTGDTAPSDDIRDLASGSDLLLAEATLDEPESGSVRGHLTAHQAAELAASAGVGSLMLTHFWHDADRQAAVEEARSWLETDVLLAEDGAVLEF